MIQINYKKLYENSKDPVRKYDVDAGFDLSAAWKKEKDLYVEYGTGIAFEIPVGYVGLVFPRSSITKVDYILKNSVGVIDSSYRGEICLRFVKAYNETVFEIPEDEGVMKHSVENKLKHFININKTIKKELTYYKIGDRIGQIVFQKLPDVKLNEVNELSKTIRNEDGFGSTGK